MILAAKTAHTPKKFAAEAYASPTYGVLRPRRVGEALKNFARTASGQRYLS